MITEEQKRILDNLNKWYEKNGFPKHPMNKKNKRRKELNQKERNEKKQRS